MRCLSCNKQLNDREATRKYTTSGRFLDLCDRCFGHVADEIPHLEGHGGESSDEDYSDFSETDDESD